MEKRKIKKTDMINQMINKCDNYIAADEERKSLREFLKSSQLKFFFYDYNTKEIDSWTSSKIGKKRSRIIVQIMEEIKGEFNVKD